MPQLQYVRTLLAVLLLLLPLAGCSDDFYPMHSEESQDFHPVQTGVEDSAAFLAEIETYASTFENDLILGSIQFIYDPNLDYKIDFEFSIIDEYDNEYYTDVFEAGRYFPVGKWLRHKIKIDFRDWFNK